MASIDGGVVIVIRRPLDFKIVVLPLDLRVGRTVTFLAIKEILHTFSSHSHHNVDLLARKNLNRLDFESPDIDCVPRLLWTSVSIKERDFVLLRYITIDIPFNLQSDVSSFLARHASEAKEPDVFFGYKADGVPCVVAWVSHTNVVIGSKSLESLPYNSFTRNNIAFTNNDYMSKFSIVKNLGLLESFAIFIFTNDS